MHKRDNWDEIRILVQNFKSISVHGIFDISQPDIAYKQIDLCKHVGASILVVHPNMLGFKALPDIRNGWNHSLSFAEDLINYGTNSGVAVAVENILSFDMIDKIVQALPRIKVCIDTGHANLDKNKTIDHYLRHFKDKVVHYHLSDNHGPRGKSLNPVQADLDDYD